MEGGKRGAGIEERSMPSSGMQPFPMILNVQSNLLSIFGASGFLAAISERVGFCFWRPQGLIPRKGIRFPQTMELGAEAI